MRRRNVERKSRARSAQRRCVKVKLDENTGRRVFDLLVEAGHDVATVVGQNSHRGRSRLRPNTLVFAGTQRRDRDIGAWDAFAAGS